MPERWVLASLSTCMLLSSLGTSIANVGLPTFAEAFGASFQAVQWIVLAYLLAITAMIVTVGRLGDLTGRKRLLVSGIVLFTAASVACGAAPSLAFLVAARAVQGLGAAIMMALSIAFVGDTVPKERMGRAMGILGTMSAVGTALAPSLGGILISALGWPALFLFNAPLGVAAYGFARRYLPADARRQEGARPRFDTAGTVWLALTLGAYAFAMTTGRGSFGAVNAACLAAAAVGAVLFVLAERRAESPLVRFAMFRDAVLRSGLATSALVSTVMMATLVVGPFYLSRALGLGTASVGLALSVGPIMVAFTGVPAGRFSDRFGAARMTVAGLGLMVAGAAMLALVPLASGIAGYLCAVVVITVGYGLFQTANNTAVMADVRSEQRGVVSGMLNLARNLGLVTGASVMGAVFAYASAAPDLTTAQPEAIARGLHATFAVAAVLMVVALSVAAGSRPKAVAAPMAQEAA